MSKPTLVFIPGFWEGPTVFSNVTTILNQQHAYPTSIIPLVSTGTSGPSAKSFSSDVSAIRVGVEDLANKGTEILVIMHSAGGFIGSQALKGLSLTSRKERGLAGGVRKLVYLTAALLPENSDHGPRPFFQTIDDRMYPLNPLPSLFNDIPAPLADDYAQSLSWQPSTYVDSIHVDYCAWKEIPSVFLCCAQDQVIPLEVQRQIAEMAGAEMETCDAGHMVILSQPERVVEFVREAAGGV